MPHLKERRLIRSVVPRLGAVACFVAALALMAAGSAVAEPPAPKTSAPAAECTIAAADGAGWMVFKGHRSERADHLAPSTVGVGAIANPDAPHIPAADRLNRWGALQASAVTR